MRVRYAGMKSPVVRLLRARSFVGGHCGLTRRGLALELQLDGEDLEIVLGEEAARRVTHGVRPARFVLNPPTVPKRRLMESLERAEQRDQRRRTAQGIAEFGYQIGFGQPEPDYDCKWFAGPADAGVEEGQELVLACLQGSLIAGYAGLRVRVFSDAETKTAELYLSVHLVYVRPARRGRGLGMSLAVATGVIAIDVLSAVVRSVPAGYTVHSCLEADYTSDGGEVFMENVFSEMNAHHDVLQAAAGSRGVSLVQPVLDAGW